jgi:mannan endo-1,4-beta-mannosidase
MNHSLKKKMKNKSKWFSTAAASALILSTMTPVYAQTATMPSKESSAKVYQPLGNNAAHAVENFVDPLATDKTKSLFEYLQNTRGKHVLFGDQHATDEGLTLTSGLDQLQSDVKNSVGDFPAVFGWDTLSLEGKEKPGVANNYEQSRENLTAAMKKVHNLGGIVTLSSHMPNFVTGGSFNDTAGSVVEHILPGGDKNVEFNAFLDKIAEFANNLKDDKGNLIPVLYRPFHEQNGGWFWWGAKTTTTSQYVEIYRYTVEYLRDKKGVHNFLYVFSPNGSFGGNKDTYLTTYPGDDYVDILGMDQYDNQSNPGSKQFLNNMVSDLGMISKLADEKGKIATFSEFGYSPQGMKVSGNGDLNWFTDLINAIKADPDAKRIAYMLTWANFGTNGNLFVPYHNAPNGLGDHELLPDFIKYYNDPYTSFLEEVGNPYHYKVQASSEQPFMHVASPTVGETITTPKTTIRARVLNENPSRVTYSVAGSQEVEMKLDQDGYYSADWSPTANFNGSSADITVNVYGKDGAVKQTQNVKVFVKVPEISIKKYTFDSNIDGIQNNGTWPTSIATNFDQASLGGDGKLKMGVTGLNSSDSWQELKLQLTNLPQTDLQYVKRVKFDSLIPTSLGSANSNASIRGVAMLPPDWDTKYGMTTTEQKLSELEKVTIDGVEYAKYPVTIDITDPAKLAAAQSLAISLVGNGLEGDAPIYIDNIELLNTYSVAPTDPAVVDDFESYQGDNAALATKFVHAGGDATAVTLDGTHKSNGTYGLKFDYTLAGSGYAGITKTLGGVDWSGFNKLKFWLAPDGKNQKMVIQIKVDGVSYEAYPSLASTTPGYVEIPFNQFTVAPWDTANLGKTLNKVNLKNVQEFSIYVNAVNDATINSSLYLDDIKAINDGTGGVPNGGTGPGSTPEKPGILYDFESDTQGWQVEQNQAGATAPAVTTAAAATGSQSLQSTFDLAKTGGFEMDKVQAADLSAVKTISAKVKLSAGSANVRLYIKTGSNWDWHDSGVVAVDSSSAGYTTLTIQLDPAWGLDKVQSIGIKVEPTNGTGNASCYLDDVELAN